MTYIYVRIRMYRILYKKLIVTSKVSSLLYIVTRKGQNVDEHFLGFPSGNRDQRVTSSAKRSTELRAFQPRP